VSETVDGEPTFLPVDGGAWRDWLERNGERERVVWVAMSRAGGGVGYEEAVESALCYGWIDGKTKRRDDTSTWQRFTPRKPASTWSPPNRERVARLTAAGLMRPQGQAMVDLAKATGTWDPLSGPDAEAASAELRAALAKDPAAQANYDAFPPSAKQLLLGWIVAAKRPDTRTTRITRTVAEAARNRRAHP
jgi:uncharacterized protein YdeI (YjbR/CyaY-like superfamily)